MSLRTISISLCIFFRLLYGNDYSWTKAVEFPRIEERDK